MKTTNIKIPRHWNGLFILAFLLYMSRGIVCNICISKQTCGECIEAYQRCTWCSQEGFSENGASRCDYEANLKEKGCKDIQNLQSSSKIIKNEELSNKGAKEGEAIQIKPQEIKIRLRPNSKHSFQVKFRQAVDYPVDLYYLMDLSYSMADDKESLARLGDKLADRMGNITTNFTLGFGSFVDKTTAPYVSTHPDKLKEPCSKCASPYGYRNNMPLSPRTHEFAQKVREAPVSGNLDAPEGGFDAIMQAIVCKEEINWRNKARKLLVFSTDNSFHYAGDGKLGGIITPNDEKCHLDDKGYYTKETEQDYPSLSQINKKIKEHKVNIIFAVTKEQEALYKQLSSRLVGSTTGKLDADSGNVVDLVQNQYDKITSAVEMSSDLPQDSNIVLAFYSKCLGDEMEKTSTCKGLKVERSVTFDVELSYFQCPKDRSQWNTTFNIYPVGLQEHLKVNLEMLCECDCEKPWNEEPSSPKCTAGNGTFECGICNCNEMRSGKECECDGSQADRYQLEKACFRGNETKECSGLGTCRCGQCDCHPRPNPKEKIYGTHCECNNFSCDKHNEEFCGGEDHGECDCGKCKCRNGWIGDDCSCRDSPESCVGTDGKECSGHGYCKCGVCICSQEYFGKHCDDCSTCPGMCLELRKCVECWLENQKGANHTCVDCGSTIVTPVEFVEVEGQEKQCSFEDEEKCRFTFKYAFNDQNNLEVHIKTEKECPQPVDAVAIAAGVSGGVVATGLFLLMLWKVLTTIHDRREYARFEKERSNARWQQGENPIYKQATSTHPNPAYQGD